MRQLVGYDRFEGERAYRQLAELYRAVRLYVNFFQPSMKLRTKTRTGALGLGGQCEDCDHIMLLTELLGT